MPGRTPAEAVAAFLEPLQSALSCVVHAKIVPSPGGRGDTSRVHAWSLNGGAGAVMSGAVLLKAGMHYRIIEDEGERGPWRVTTTGYMYSLEDETGAELFAAHWHPETAGEHKEPHYHFPTAAFSDAGTWIARAPIPSGRFTLEEMIRFTIVNRGIPPLCQDWRDRLDLAETPHRLYRTWHLSPEERAARRSAD